jgi:mannosyltransferase
MSAPPRKRRLFLDSTIFDLQQDGGISRYWYELVSNLALRYTDWDLTLFADPNTTNKFGRKLLEMASGRPNVHRHDYIPRQAGRFFGPRLRDDYKGFLWHSSYYRVPGRLNIPQVCTVHDFIYQRYFSGPMAWLHQRKMRRAIMHAQQIICPSDATKRELLRFYPHIDDSRCHVVYHGVSADFRRAAGGDEPKPPGAYALFVGSRARYKNFRLTVLSVQLIPNLQLFIVGGRTLSSAEIVLLNAHLAGRYRVFASPTDEMLRDLYRSATALAYLSRCEGFGFPPLEAMACGCPVIATDASSIPEVVGDAAILLSSEDPMVVAEALRAVQSADRRAELIARGINRAQRFSWDRAVDETVRTYERALQ